jgi:hypothetical protein
MQNKNTLNLMHTTSTSNAEPRQSQIPFPIREGCFSRPEAMCCVWVRGLAILSLGIGLLHADTGPVSKSSTAEPTPAGKVRLENGNFFLDGKGYKAVGINIPHLHQAHNGTFFHTELYPSVEAMQSSITRALDDAAANGAAFVRFFAVPGYPIDQARIYDEDPDAYWKAMDQVLEMCRERGLRVMPVLGIMGWRGQPERHKEPIHAALDPSSKSCQEIHSHITTLVTRYRNDPVILMWSLSNEGFLKADIDYSKREAENPIIFTPGSLPKDQLGLRFQKEVYHFPDIVAHYRHWTDIIHRLDPGTPVTSGDAGIRAESVSRREGVAASRKEGIWPPPYKFRKDTLDEHLAHLLESQSPVDVASIHAYFEGAEGKGEKVLNDDISRFDLQIAQVRALRAVGMAVLVGETSQRAPFLRKDPAATTLLPALRAMDAAGAQLIALWSWHFPWQDSRVHAEAITEDWSIEPGSDHPELMKFMVDYNQRHAGSRTIPTRAAATTR